MGPIGILALVLAAPASPPEPPAFAEGVGYTVSQLLRQLDEPPDASESPPSLRPIPRRPPPSTDLARIQGSPRARGLSAAVAVAAQLAMIVAGVMSVREQNERMRREREGQAPPYKPYR